MNKESIIKAFVVLAVLLTVLFTGFVLIRVFVFKAEAVAISNQSEPATLDANEALKSTIDTLEMLWEQKQAYDFYVSTDPLYLGRVIKDFKYVREGHNEVEEEESIRLTATVVDANPKAIIKYSGKSYVVQAGDWIGRAFRVISIDAKEVVLDQGGVRKVLYSKRVEEEAPYEAPLDLNPNPDNL